MISGSIFLEDKNLLTTECQNTKTDRTARRNTNPLTAGEFSTP